MTAEVKYHPWLFRYAVLTATVALLLPIMMGALVTTTDTGMAFRDWPSSDGHNMLLYPWLSATWDKFLEHGHRLAGGLIGLMSIGLVALTFRLESRRWVRGLSFVILLGVISQGLLGGQRVLLDQRGLACLHGIFASWVFALMGSMALVLSRSWIEASRISVSGWSQWWSWSAWCACAIISMQYVLGGLLRHQGTVLYEHIGFAVLVLLSVLAIFAGAQQSRIGWLMRPAVLLTLLVVVQMLVGFGAFITKFGMGQFNPVHGSLPQILFRTGHVLVGMLVWLTAILYALRASRLQRLNRGRLVGQPSHLAPTGTEVAG